MNTFHLSIKDILSEEVREQIQESFALATGFGVVFTDPHGNHIGSGSNFCKLCMAINEDEIERASCVQSNKHAIRLGLQMNQPSIYICHAGMVNIEIPLQVDDKLVGAITAGQVLAEDASAFPSDEQMNYLRLREIEPYSAYYQEIPTLSNKQIFAAAAALENIAKYITGTYKSEQMSKEMLKREKQLFAVQLAEQALQQQLAEARFAALQKQITPHFMHNILSSVSRLIDLGEPEKSRLMLDSFSSMLRYHYGMKSSIVTLADEIAYIKEYLQIQSIRFEDRIKHNIEIDPQLLDLKIPIFSLQPFVENAIEHGLLVLEDGGTIHLRINKIHDYACIRIHDNGIGIKPDTLSQIRDQQRRMTSAGSNGFGIVNSSQRLILFFGAKHVHFHILSQPHRGTEIMIDIDLSEKND